MVSTYTTLPKTLIQTPYILVFGSSTGGLNALTELMKELHGKKVDIPILITQHIPKNFDGNFVETLEKESGLPCFIGEEGMLIENGNIYVAPAGCHMEIRKKGDKVKIKLNDDPPINFCKPAVDPLLFSTSRVYGKNILAVMLTGIGTDGLEGSKELVARGGTLIAQDEETSVVWGMPGAVAKAGICTEILPLNKIIEFILKSSFGKIR